LCCKIGHYIPSSLEIATCTVLADPNVAPTVFPLIENTTSKNSIDSNRSSLVIGISTVALFSPGLTVTLTGALSKSFSKIKNPCCH